MSSKFLSTIPAPIKRTAKYIGCRKYLYIPRVISGAPGIGIGETLNDGFKLKYAINRTRKPTRKIMVATNSTTDDVNSGAP